MSKLRVLVVGASIAGPTAAYWLAKAGANVTVIERFPQLRTNGQNVDIRTAGVTVMRRTPGMEAAVRAKVMSMDGISFIRSDGYSYGILRATGNPDQQSLISEYEIFRGDLARILFDLTKDNKNIKYVFGEQIASMQQNEREEDGPIKVEFANGLPTSEYDLVVACDGATSRTRAIGLGCGVRDHVKPVNTWAAFFSIEGDLLEGSRTGLSYSSVPGRFVGLGPDPKGDPKGTDPSAKNKVVAMGVNRRDDDDSMLAFRAAVKQGDDALKRFIAQHYEGAGWKTPEIMKRMLKSEDFYANEIVQVKLPSLYKGRFVLVGDAGYCPGPTGGGTTLAIAGAYVLAGEICMHKGDLAAGLQGYEERMRPIITDMQQIPYGIPGIIAPQTAWGLWLRNNIFGFIVWTGVIGFAQKYFANAFAPTEKYKLPEYEWVA